MSDESKIFERLDRIERRIRWIGGFIVILETLAGWVGSAYFLSKVGIFGSGLLCGFIALAIGLAIGGYAQHTSDH
jgi:hypothetical protein